MKILFIICETNMYPRLGVMCLSAALKKYGNEVRMVNAGRLSQAQLFRRVGEYSPEIVAYTAATGEHRELLRLNRALKTRFDFVAVFGGPHATFSPDLIEEASCDAVCVGEGDVAFPEFCRRLEEGEAYWESPNFVVKRDGAIHRNALLPLVSTLDDLPFPDHDLTYECEPDLANEGTKSFMGSRGCPYACTYCFNRKYNEIYAGKGPILRHRSPESLVEEVCQVKARYKLDYVIFQDDTFLLKPPGWFDTFVDEYRQRVGLPFACTIRANVVKEDLIKRLASAGLRVVWTGVECGDDHVANSVLGRGLTGEQLVDAARIVQRNGVLLVATNVLGLPVENPYETDLKTLDLNMRIRPTYALSGLLYPYPGTPVHAMAVKDGYLRDADAPILETNKRSSAFAYASPLEKRRVENLHKLFDWIVQFPWLRRYCDFLCGLPLRVPYRLLYYSRFGYIYKWRLFPFRCLRREIWMWVRFFARRIRRT